MTRDLLEVLYVTTPRLAKVGEQTQHLVGILFHGETGGRLAHHTQERIQREWRTQHDPLGYGFVDEARFVLLDEPEHTLVGDEQQHVVERVGVGLLHVVAVL